jgi:drug/metabolite transporter (DMT)-like permease
VTLTAAVLIIISAFMHAFWNLVGKRRNPSLAFFFMTSVAAAFVALPILLFYSEVLPRISLVVWGLILATGLAQTLYFSGLAGAYRRGDISLAYPLARAMPVLLVAGVNLALGKGEQIRTLGLAGMFLVAAGCLVLPLHSFRDLAPRRYFDAVYIMALAAAIGTTGYTLIDDQALRQLRASDAVRLSTTEVTLLFIALQTTSTALLLGLASLLLPAERRRLGQMARDRSLLAAGALTGVIIMTTYGLVLAAMAYVTNVSYVAAFRQLSIPIGAFFGLTIQKEPRFAPKLIGIGVVSLGLILVGIG